jgi:hypothetical protein
VDDPDEEAFRGDEEPRREPDRSANSDRLIVALATLTQVIQFVSAIMGLVGR